MKTLLICEDLKKYITSERTIEGRIHSVFSKACNIDTKRSFITLLSGDRQMAPMSAILGDAGEVNFMELGLQHGDTVYLSVNDIYCPKCNFLVDFEEAVSWSSNINIDYTFVSEEELLKNIHHVQSNLRLHGKLQSIGPLFNYISKQYDDLKMFYLEGMNLQKGCEFAAVRFLNFFQAAANGDIDNIADAAKGIIGFGSGLTPSADDFISGFMSALISLGHYYKLSLSKIFEFNERLISQSLNNTTKVSSEMLKHSSHGRVNEAVKELMKSITSEKNEEKVIKALIKTINFGETSGSDTALGIYAGCKLLTNLKYRRVWVNEAMCGY